ncbi:hypothetical protein [Dyella caseinilytica]|uniref:Uncharacterized protein n=1 Tax=Dyella caseinilytica TaxID=1849581 RepID=A0ABX7GR13_9GAMM|nr:hypothetical protein [Dyella caseinilytica]QRN52501.1 hypothetical protein ISN74_13600 [Dyella caseinilytica]GGA06580.1 hypothetical protein GCM10011408_29480 [Dyella caseinilytica]
MSHFKPNSQPTKHEVDWDDPHLQRLLSKTDGWKLDNRGAFTAINVQLHVGWGASTGRHATLVWESDQVMVLETRFLIPQGEQVRVDRIQAGVARTVWGTVVEGREGFREDDRRDGIYVHWLHAR